MILGAVVGLHNGWRLHGDFIAIIAQALAGIVVFAVMGILLGLFANRARESLLGGAFGLLIGCIAHFACAIPQTEVIDVCLLVGALVGATCWPWIGGAIRLGTTIYALLGRLRREM
jgi:hypothetical protein